MTKNDWKYVIKRVITYIAIAMIMLLLGSCNVKAFSFNVNASKYSDTLITAQTKSIGLLSSGEKIVTFNLNNDITCDTDTCGLEFFYQNTCSFQITDLNSQGVIHTFNIEIPAINSQLNDSKKYPFCSVNQNTISCIVDKNVHLSAISVYLNGPSNMPSGTSSTGAGCDLRIGGTFSTYNISSDLGTAINNNTEAVNNVNNTLNDDTAPSSSDISSSSSDWSSNNTDSGVINNLVLMPISLLNSVVTGLSGTCSTYTIGELWGENLTLPCINLSNILGSVWTIIDVIMSGVFIFVFGKRCVKIFNDFTNLRSGQIDSLYGGGE